MHGQACSLDEVTAVKCHAIVKDIGNLEPFWNWLVSPPQELLEATQNGVETSR